MTNVLPTVRRLLGPVAAVCLLLAACQRTETARRAPGSSPATRTATARPAPSPSTEKPTEPQPNLAAPAAVPAPDTKSQRVAVSPTYDQELRQIIDLARRNHWEEAEARASALYALDPKDASVQRVYTWVKTEGPKRREKALEDKIRDLSSRDTRFNPTIESLLTDPKFPGLPPRSDLREAIEQIKATPYIPESFGKTIQSKGMLEDFQSPQGRMAALLDKQIEVHLDNVPLEKLIFNVGQAEGINFIADKSIPAFQQRLSINATSLKLGELLDYVSRNLGVQFQVGEDLIWITDAKDTNKLHQVNRFYRLRKGFVLPAQFGISDATKTTVTANNVTTVTEVQRFENFVRDGAPQSPAIEVAIQNFFKGKYQIDYERNLIVARGTEEQLRIMDRIVQEFDKPIQQVLIEARFITVTEAKFLQLGVAWETGRGLTAGRTPTDFTGLGVNVGLGLEETWTGVLGRKTLSATLTALDQSGESETLSAPRVTLVNNLPANIQDGKIQYYYEEYKVSQTILERRSTSTLVPLGKPTSLVSGVSLDVLASIGSDGKSILLALNPEVSEDVVLKTFATVTDRDDQGRLVSTFDIRLPELRKQSLATRVTVKSGQTVVMGGVLQREQKTFVEAVPVLSRIPIIGAAFRRRTEVDRPRYLLVFVTATILSENGEFVVSAEAE